MRGDRIQFFSSIMPSFLVNLKENIVMLGDFNAIEYIQDRISTKSSKIEVYKSLSDLIKSVKLIDSWRFKHPKSPGHTFFYTQGSARLDRIYVNNNVAHSINNLYTEPFADSDHVAIIIEVNGVGPSVALSNPKSKNMNPWKFNCSLLNDVDFCDDFINLWTRLNTFLPNMDILEWWEKCLKIEVKKLAQRHGARKKRMELIKKQFHLSLINEMMESREKGKTNDEEWALLKNEITCMQKNIMEGVGIRSRFEWNIESESPSLVHFDHEKKEVISIIYLN